VLVVGRCVKRKVPRKESSVLAGRDTAVPLLTKRVPVKVEIYTPATSPAASKQNALGYSLIDHKINKEFSYR